MATDEIPQIVFGAKESPPSPRFLLSVGSRGIRLESGDGSAFPAHYGEIVRQLNARYIMMLKTDGRTLDECVGVAMDAADASNSDYAALVGCMATQDQGDAAAFKRQCEQFQDLADRLRRWQSRIDGGDETQDDTAKRQLLADLRLLLTAVRVAAFDIALHGRDAGLTDTEIADELTRYAKLDSRLRGNILPRLKADLGVTDTKAL